MTLDEAIDHCYEKSNDKTICEECRLDHKQLYNWLTELKKLKVYFYKTYKTVTKYNLE